MPPYLAPYMFGLLLSGFMSLIVSGIATARSVGFPPDFLGLWITGWASSWLVAFPVVLIVAPVVRRLVARMVRHPD